MSTKNSIPTLANIKWGEEFDVYIGRENTWLNLPASKWANPFVLVKKSDRPKVVADFREYAEANQELIDSLHELTGKVLGCYCCSTKRNEGKLCHGSVLIELYKKYVLKDYMKTKIIVYDFDGTLVHSPTDTPENRKLWSDHMGMDYSSVNKGWWGCVESINTNVYHIPLNGWVYNKYVTDKADESTKIYLATGRLQKKPGMFEQVKSICDGHGLEFEEIFCSTGPETYIFKTRQFEKLIVEHPEANEFIMYDDRQEHLVKFIDWGKEMAEKYKIKVTIIDVLNKKQIL